MKVLHLLSMSKWTGAAEPVFYLCRELMSRGHEVQLAYALPFQGRRLSSRNIRRGKLSLWVESEPAPNRPTLEQKAKELGLITRSDLRLNVYGNVLDMLSDYFTLRRILRSEQFDLVHCHLPLACYLAALARELNISDRIIMCNASAGRAGAHRSPVPPGNADELVRAIQSFLEQPAKAQLMGRATRQKALEELSISRVGAEVENIYQRLIKE